MLKTRFIRAIFSNAIKLFRLSGESKTVKIVEHYLVNNNNERTDIIMSGAYVGQGEGFYKGGV